MSTGYGELRYNGKYWLAHRAMWEVHNGRPVPKGMVIRHDCDNRACVNIDHIDIDTYKGNDEDMRRKGRQVDVRGEDVGLAKITEAEAIDIIRLLPIASDAEIARKYGLSRHTVYAIRYGRTWRHLPRITHAPCDEE